MGERTKIPYVDSTCNLVMGCSQPCELDPRCFARQWCQRFAGKKGYPKDFSKPELFVHRLDELRRWKDLTGTKREAVKEPNRPFRSAFVDRGIVIPAKPWLDGLPRLVFLSDLGEMFDPALPRNYLAMPFGWLKGLWRSSTILNTIRDCGHICIILTKQPKRMAAFFAEYPCPPNLWLGVSVTDQSTVGRIDELLKIKCRVRIVSHEPATGPIDYGDRLKGIAQLISGGMSGPDAAPCDLAWLRSDREQARAAECAWFMKQIGAHAYVWEEDPSCVTAGRAVWYCNYQHPSGADPAEWPEDLQNCREVSRIN